MPTESHTYMYGTYEHGRVHTPRKQQERVGAKYV